MAAATIRGGDRRLRPLSSLRYRAVMRKMLPKLALRKDSIRALSGAELTHAAGGQGDDAVVAIQPTIGKECQVAALALTS